MWYRRILALTMASLFTIAAASASANGGHGDDDDNTCYTTTTVMKYACRSDIVDDYYESIAKCLNSEDVSECKREARTDYRLGRAECSEQAEARNALCGLLPDAGPYIVELNPENFGDCTEGNKYLPLVPGTVTTFINPSEDEPETVIVTVTDETREIEGIEAIIVNDQVFEGWPDEQGNLNEDQDPIEDTDDYYAVANNCDVYYLGEVAQNFEDGYLTDLDGSFVVGESGAQAGIVMFADPASQLGQTYRQEFALGDAEDAATVLSVDADVDLSDDPFPSVPYTCMGACLLTEDFVGNELDSSEFKYYVEGVGIIAETDPDGEVVLKLIKIEAGD